MTKINYKLTITILQSTFKEYILHKIYFYHSLYLFRAIVLLRFFVFVLQGNEMFESDGAKFTNHSNRTEEDRTSNCFIKAIFSSVARWGPMGHLHP